MALLLILWACEPTSLNMLNRCDTIGQTMFEASQLLRAIRTSDV